MRISDGSSDVCSAYLKEAPTDLAGIAAAFRQLCGQGRAAGVVDEDDALGGHRLALDADQAGGAGERDDLGPAERLGVNRAVGSGRGDETRTGTDLGHG